MKKLLLGALAIIAVIGLTACGEPEVKNEPDTNTVVNASQTQNTENEQPAEEGNKKEDEVGTAGSNMPLIDNAQLAYEQAKIAMENLLKDTWKEKISNLNVNITKIYTSDEVQSELFADYNLTMNEVPFEASYELKPADDVTDFDQFTAGTGKYDEATGWIVEKSNVGILCKTENGYTIKNLGTGF